MGCLLIFISLNDARGSDWVHLVTDGVGNNSFYDKDSIRNVSKGVVGVWTKTVYSDEGRARVIYDYAKSGFESAEYESLGYSKELFFINCVDEKYKITQGANYASDGHVLDDYHEDSVWDAPPPDSVMDSLVKEICKNPKRSK